MCKTLYQRLLQLRGREDLYFACCKEVESEQISMNSDAGAFITLYRLVKQGLTEAIDLSPDSYYIIQALYDASGKDLEELDILASKIVREFDFL